MSDRAAHGESSMFFNHEDGRWHGFVSMGVKRGGRRDRRHVSSTSRAVVVRKMRDLERRRDEGFAGVDSKPPTLAEWLEHWLDNIAAAKVRPSTLATYRSYVDNRIAAELGHHRLDRLAPEHLEAFYRDCEKEGLAPASVLQMHRILSRALKIAVQRGRVARNVATLVDAPSVTRDEVKPLTRDEARQILAAAAQRRDGPRWAVALALGLRQGEALGLRWADVDLDEGTITIRWALQRQPGGGLVFVPPKSAKSRRTILLPAELATMLRKHRAAQKAERLAARRWEDQDLVFCQPNGLPYDPRSDLRAWKQLLRDAGVRETRLHDARHTAATLMLQMHIKPRVVMEILGHSQIGLTLGTYSHVVRELAEDAAKRIDEALWS